MPAHKDRLGHYITSEAFFARVREAVEEAVSKLEAQGLTPIYDHPKRAVSTLDSGVVVKVSTGESSAKREIFKAA